jgi:hypothetical protein
MTQKEVKAIIINPIEKTFTPVIYNGDYKTIYNMIECDCFDVVRCEVNGHPLSIYVDDEGLFKQNLSFFLVRDMPQPLAGMGLIFGEVDEEGYDTDAPDLELIKDGFRFMDILEVVNQFGGTQ